MKSTIGVSNEESPSDCHEEEERFQFPWKLHQLLEDAEQNPVDHAIVSWMPCGKAFRIHNKIKFAAKLMPMYFTTTNYKSFHRSLNMWGFESVRQGLHKGACYNAFFVRGHPEQCNLMKRVRIKSRSTISETIVARSIKKSLTAIRPLAVHSNTNILSENRVPSIDDTTTSPRTRLLLQPQSPSWSPVAAVQYLDNLTRLLNTLDAGRMTLQGHSRAPTTNTATTRVLHLVGVSPQSNWLCSIRSSSSSSSSLVQPPLAPALAPALITPYYQHLLLLSCKASFQQQQTLQLQTPGSAFTMTN